MIRGALAFLLVLAACNPSTGGTDTDPVTGTSTGADAGTSTGADTSASASTGDASASTAEPTTSSEPPRFTPDVWPILQSYCSCHTQMIPGPATDFFMGEDAPTAYGAIVDVPSSITGLDQVEPGSLETSYLYHKVAGTQFTVGGNGDRMPPVVMIGADDLATIAAWIEAGALK